VPTDGNLGCDIQLVVHYHSDHGVAASDRMIGKEQHREALPGDLDGACHRSLAGQLAVTAALERLA
jgi:hypothetical protein